MSVLVLGNGLTCFICICSDAWFLAELDTPCTFINCAAWWQADKYGLVAAVAGRARAALAAGDAPLAELALRALGGMTDAL